MLCKVIIVMFIINVYKICEKKYIYINNIHMDRWFILKKGIIRCKRSTCIVSKNKKYKYNAFIYNRYFLYKNITKTKNAKNVLINLEAASRWKGVNRIADGTHSHFDLLISYKLLLTKHHISNPYYVDIDEIIKQAKNSIESENSFIKRKDIVFIYRRPYINRNKLCEMFNRKIKVDKYGSAFRYHLQWPKNISNNKYMLIKRYKFCLAIENTINQVKWGQLHSDPIDDDYVTEKLWDCLRGGSIPIYFGAKNIEKFYPTNISVINVNDFHNYSECINYVISVLNNKRILRKYINWPFTYSKNWYNRMKFYSITPCKMCNYIHNSIT